MMKRLSRRGWAIGLVLLAIAGLAAAGWHEGLFTERGREEWQLHRLQRRMAKDLAAATQVELLHIGYFTRADFSKAKQENRERIEDCPIWAKSELSPEAARELSEALRATLLAKKVNPALCYEPHHAVKIRDAEGKILCEGTICTHCNQFHLTGRDGKIEGAEVGPELRRVLKAWDVKDGFDRE